MNVSVSGLGVYYMQWAVKLSWVNPAHSPSLQGLAPGPLGLLKGLNGKNNR